MWCCCTEPVYLRWKFNFLSCPYSELPGKGNKGLAGVMLRMETEYLRQNYHSWVAFFFFSNEVIKNSPGQSQSWVASLSSWDHVRTAGLWEDVRGWPCRLQIVTPSEVQGCRCSHFLCGLGFLCLQMLGHLIRRKPKLWFSWAQFFRKYSWAVESLPRAAGCFWWPDMVLAL